MRVVVLLLVISLAACAHQAARPPLRAKLVKVEEVKSRVILRYDKGADHGVMAGWWATPMTSDDVGSTRIRVARVTSTHCEVDTDESIKKLIAIGFDGADLEAPVSTDPAHPGTYVFCAQAFAGDENTIECEDPAVTALAPLAGRTPLRSLTLRGTGVTDLAPLAGLTGLMYLWLADTPVTDLAPLRTLTHLESLDLVRAPVTDLAPLAGLTTLRNIDLDGAKVTDLRPLAGLTRIYMLKLADTAVTDVSPLRGLTALTLLDLSRTPVTDLSPLASLTGLETLYVGAQVSDAQVDALRAALPALEIERD